MLIINCANNGLCSLGFKRADILQIRNVSETDWMTKSLPETVSGTKTRDDIDDSITRQVLLSGIGGVRV